MRLKLCLLLGFGAVVFAITRAPSAAAAATGSNITVRPFLQQLDINPDEASKQISLTINNGSQFTQSFHLSAVNFGSLGETGGLVFQGADVSSLNNTYGLARWLKIDRPDLDIPAGRQAVINVTITNDNDLAPGAHYAAIITSASRPGAKTGQLTITPKVSSLIFATKKGGDFYNEHLESISSNGSFWKLPSSVNVRLKSTGNTYITPRGIVWLQQGHNQVYKGIINAQSAFVLPGMVRDFNVPLSKLTRFKSGLFFTRYSLRVDYRYDGNPNFATQSYSYKVINKLTVFILLVVIVLAALAAKGVINSRSWKD
jgi:hypothetical protein